MREFKAFLPDDLPQLPQLLDEPIDIEIGCGVGLHPILYCQKHPERQLIAIEHTRDKFEKFQRRAESHKLSNLFPIHANGISYVAKHFKTAAVDRFIFMYPNPNPKGRGQSRRWHRMPFMGFAWDCLKAGGEIHLSTNERWYMEEAIDYFTNHWQFPIAQTYEVHLATNPDWQARTHFEKKYLERGETSYNLILRKAVANS